MSGDIKAGDLVVCVDAAPPRTHIPERPPLVTGRVYRVAKIRLGETTGRPMLGIQPADAGKHWCWYAERFRKLNDEPDDIALIERIKRPIRTHHDA